MSIHQEFEALAKFAQHNSFRKIEREVARLKMQGAFTVSATKGQRALDVMGMQALDGHGGYVYPLRPVGFASRFEKYAAHICHAPHRDPTTFFAPFAAALLSIMAISDAIKHQSMGSGLLAVPLVLLTGLLARGLKGPQDMPNMVGISLYADATDTSLSADNTIERALFNESLNQKIRVIEYYDPARDKRKRKDAVPVPHVAG